MTTKNSPLLTPYRRASRVWRGDAFGARSFGSIWLGCETRTVPAEYRWDGLRRGTDPRHPRVMFQATLAGSGMFERGNQRWTIGEDTCFFAVLPSRHIYYLSEESPEWTFFWFTFDHPYVVQRLSQLAKSHSPVFPLAQNSPLAAQCLTFFERVCYGRFEDQFAEESALLDWMLGFERHLHDLAHPSVQRDAMLEELRRYTHENMSRSFGIEEVARRRGLSRSHYSHQFKDATGLAPASYVLEVRLAEARRSLREKPHEPLKDIAAETGFADANHFCKAFRRQFHMSPGAYRLQVR